MASNGQATGFIIDILGIVTLFKYAKRHFSNRLSRLFGVPFTLVRTYSRFSTLVSMPSCK